MTKRTMEVIKVCKGLLDSRTKEAVHTPEERFRVWMTEVTGVDWFEYPYLESMFNILSSALREVCGSAKGSFEAMCLWDLFDAYKREVRLFDIAESENPNKVAEKLWYTINESLMTTLALISVRDEGNYINGFTEKDFEEEITISEETIQIFLNHKYKRKEGAESTGLLDSNNKEIFFGDYITSTIPWLVYEVVCCNKTGDPLLKSELGYEYPMIEQSKRTLVIKKSEED